VVPARVIDNLLYAIGLDPQSGLLDKTKQGAGSFTSVQQAVKGVMRDGWSAGQVLQQVGAALASAAWTAQPNQAPAP
jgi:hypothetical protein